MKAIFQQFSLKCESCKGSRELKPLWNIESNKHKRQFYQTGLDDLDNFCLLSVFKLVMYVVMQLTVSFVLRI